MKKERKREPVSYGILDEYLPRPLITGDDVALVKAICTGYLDFWRPWVERCPTFQRSLEAVQAVLPRFSEQVENEQEIYFLDHHAHTLYELMTFFKQALVTMPISEAREEMLLQVERLAIVFLLRPPYRVITLPVTTIELAREDFESLEDILTSYLQTLQRKQIQPEPDAIVDVQRTIIKLRRRIREHIRPGNTHFEDVSFFLTIAETEAIQEALDGFMGDVKDQMVPAPQRDQALTDIAALRYQLDTQRVSLHAQAVEGQERHEN